MLAIATVAGGEWPARALAAAKATSSSAGDQSIRVALLSDIKSVFAEKGADRLSSATLVDALTNMEGRPWAEYRNGKPISANGLARALGPFCISPGTIRYDDHGGSSTAKGYHLKQFDDAFRRYLPYQGDSNRHNVTSLEPQGFAADEQPSQDVTLLRLRTPENPKNSAGCDVVTVENPLGAGNEEEIEL